MASLYWAVILLAGLACSSAETTEETLGTATSVEEYPSIAQVESRVGVLWLQQCAASVLTSYHVLSAASCFENDPTFTTRTRRIRAGSSYRGVDGTVVEVYSVYIHPSFGSLGMDGDLAVVRLETALPLGNNIAQASILGEGIYLPTGLKITLVSWGTTSEGGLTGDNQLYSLDLYTIDNDNCTKTYLGEQEQTITENMICAGLLDTNGRDLDTRDVGSPLIYSNTTVGVVSFGVARGNDSYPLVITAIASYTNWIVETAAIMY